MTPFAELFIVVMGVLVAGTYSKARTIRIEPALDIPMALLLRSELQRCQLLLWLFEVRVEPSDGAGDAIAIVGRFREVVAFVFVDDERRFDTFGF